MHPALNTLEKPQYNTHRTKLIIPEYGRHIHKMIDQIVAIKDPELKRKKSLAMIQAMGNLNPHLRDIKQFQHKLWHQLVIMSNYQLKAPSANLQPPRGLKDKKPASLDYPKKTLKYRFYGNNIKRMIDIARKWEDSQLKDFLIYAIANHMKKNYLIWNRDSVEDNVILDHLDLLSQGELRLPTKYKELYPSEILLKARGKESRNNQYQSGKNRKKKRKYNRKHS